MLTPAGLAELATVVDGISPNKERVIPRVGDALAAPTPLVRNAHAAGLDVTVWTMRAENNWLPPSLRVGGNPADFGRAKEENIAHFEAGVDGVFCDQPDVCVQARHEWRQRGAPVR